VGVADVRDRVDRRSVLSELHHAPSVAAASVTPTAAPSARHHEHERSVEGGASAQLAVARVPCSG
jgi:hypothetical protein